MLKTLIVATIGATLALSLLTVLAAIINYLAQSWLAVAIAAVLLITFCIALIKTITHEMRNK